MAGRSLEERVAALEAHVADQRLDRRFDEVEKKLDGWLESIKRDLATIRHALNVILARRA